MCYHVIQEHPYNKIYNSCTVSRCAIKLIPHSCWHREGGFMFWNISFNGLLFLFIIINHLFGDRLSIYVGICYYLCIMNITEAAMYICLWKPQYTNLSLIYCSLGQCIHSLYEILTLLVNNARWRILNIEKRDHAWIPHIFSLPCIIVIHARWEHAWLTILHGTVLHLANGVRNFSRLAGDTHKHTCVHDVRRSQTVTANNCKLRNLIEFKNHAHCPQPLVYPTAKHTHTHNRSRLLYPVLATIYIHTMGLDISSCHG